MGAAARPRRCPRDPTRSGGRRPSRGGRRPSRSWPRSSSWSSGATWSRPRSRSRRGPPVDVAGVVARQPLSGWEVAATVSFERRAVAPAHARQRQPRRRRQPVRGIRGPLAEYVTGRPRADARAALRSPSTSSPSVALGPAGVRFAYVGVFGDTRPPIEGEVTAVVTPSGRRRRLRRLGARRACSRSWSDVRHDDRPGGGALMPMLAADAAPRTGAAARRQPVPAAQPAFWLYAAIVVVTGLVSVGAAELFRKISPSGWALSWALLALYALPVLFLRLRPRPVRARAALARARARLLWGARRRHDARPGSRTRAGAWSSPALGGPEFAARWTAALTAPFVEETLKGARRRADLPDRAATSSTT